MAKLIPLTKGYSAIVDDDMYDYLMQWEWRYFEGYAVCSLRKPYRHTLRMHRIILNAPCGINVDHINRNTLDCQRKNLRLATGQQNSQNRPKPNMPTSSLYKGVSWRTDITRWKSAIKVSGKTINIGHFDLEIEAARAYDIKARELFGDFAYLNFPPQE